MTENPLEIVVTSQVAERFKLDEKIVGNALQLLEEGMPAPYLALLKPISETEHALFNFGLGVSGVVQIELDDSGHVTGLEVEGPGGSVSARKID